MPAAAHSTTPLNTDWRERYQLIGKIGSGGFADVYEAQDLTLDRRVALKIVPEGRGMSARVVREVQAAAALSHPNIVALYDWFGDGESSFIVWELVEGESLDRLPLPWATRTWSPSAPNCSRASPTLTARASCIATSSRRT